MKMKTTTVSSEAALQLPTNKEELVSFDKTFRLSWTDHEVWVNDTFLLSKPHFNTPNELFFDYIFQRPNQRIEKAELDHALGPNSHRHYSKITDDLGFRGPIKEAYFPGLSQRAVFFRPIVTSKDLIDAKVSVSDFISALKNQHGKMKR